MDIGVWMSPEVLEGKLDQVESSKPEGAWNLTRWPEGFSKKGVNRLFVASAGQWIGYFILSAEGLYLPEDKKTPFVLLFDTRSWTEISPVPTRRFRGFTYGVPQLPLKASDGLRAMMYEASRKRSSTPPEH